MFSFLRSKKTKPTAASMQRPHQTRDDSWRSGVSEGDYDDVNLEAGSSPNVTSESRASFSAPRADDGAFVNHDSPSYPPAPSSKRIASTNGYPPLRATFSRLEAFLSDASPALLDTLAPPILNSSAPELTSLLHAISPYHLPTAVIESYLFHDGQDPFASNQQGLFWGLWWMPLEQVEQEWRFWRRFEQAGGEEGMRDAFSARTEEASRAGAGRIHPYTSEDEDDGGVGMKGMTAFPPGWVRSRYSHPGWLPLLTDRTGNYIGVDLDPPPPSAIGGTAVTFGQSGQVIAFGREIDEKVVLFPGDSAGGWGRFIAAFAEDLSRGEFGRLVESERGDGRTKGPAWGAPNGVGPDGDEALWEEGDGLGDVDYVDGDRYGEEDDSLGPAPGKLWALTSEYRRWLEAEHQQGGVVAALAERSRRLWRSVGVGVAVATFPSTRTPLSVTVPEYDADDAGPESGLTERPSSSPPPPHDSTEHKSEPSEASSSRSSLNDTSMSSNNPLQPPTSPGGSVVELKVSPPSPEATRRPARLQAAAEIRAQSPEYLDDGRASSRRPAPSRRRRPPPAPVPLDLPTMIDIATSVSPQEERLFAKQFARQQYHSSGDQTLDFHSRGQAGGTPTRETLLPSRLNSASSAALVEGDDVANISFSRLGSEDHDLEVVVVDQNGAGRRPSGLALAGLSQSALSDQPYAVAI